MLAEIVEELAPTGVLRAAINMSNFLLVTGKTDDGDPVGVSPDMAGELAKRLGVGLELLKYKTPGEVADDAGKDSRPATRQIAVSMLVIPYEQHTLSRHPAAETRHRDVGRRTCRRTPGRTG